MSPESDPFEMMGVTFTPKPKHTIIEGEGITIEVAATRKGYRITATSHRGDKVHEVEAATATIRLLNELGRATLKESEVHGD